MLWMNEKYLLGNKTFAGIVGYKLGPLKMHNFKGSVQ